MAEFNASHIKNNGAFELTEKSALIKSFRDTYADITAGGAFTPTAGPADLTDSTGGTPASTLVVVRSDTGAHTAADCIANFASLNAQVKAIEDALKTSGILT